MYFPIIVPVSVYLAWFIPSTILLLLIRKYHKDKAPGLQTILDLLIVDSSNLFVVQNACMATIVFATVAVDIQYHLSFVSGQLIFLLGSNSMTLFLASLQVTQIVKALLIFKPECFENYPDQEVLKRSRIFIGGYAGLKLFFALMNPPTSNAITKLIMGTDTKLYAADDKSIVIVTIVLFLSFLALKKFSPTLPGDDQNNESCATILVDWSGEIFCVISLCFTLFVTRILVPEKYFFKFLFDLVLRVGFPAYYIYSFPSLNQFIAATFKKSILDPINSQRENASQVISNLTVRSAPPQIEVNA